MYHPKIHKVLKCQAIINFTHIMYTKSFSLKLQFTSKGTVLNFIMKTKLFIKTILHSFHIPRIIFTNSLTTN